MVDSEKMTYNPSLKLRPSYYSQDHIIAIWMFGNSFIHNGCSLFDHMIMMFSSQPAFDKQSQLGKLDSLNDHVIHFKTTVKRS